MFTSGMIPPPRVHGAVDYLLGLVLIIGPFALDFGSDTAGSRRAHGYADDVRGRAAVR